jgi:hypothetical protein
MPTSAARKRARDAELDGPANRATRARRDGDQFDNGSSPFFSPPPSLLPSTPFRLFNMRAAFVGSTGTLLSFLALFGLFLPWAIMCPGCWSDHRLAFC